MSDDIKKDVRKAVWTVVIAAIIAITGSLVQGYALQQSMSDQLEILQQEQTTIRTKLDLMQLKLERKVNRSTVDDCLLRIHEKLDEIVETMYQLQHNNYKE